MAEPRLEEEMADPDAIRDIMETFGCSEQVARGLWRRFVKNTVPKAQKDPESR